MRNADDGSRWYDHQQPISDTIVTVVSGDQWSKPSVAKWAGAANVALTDVGMTLVAVQ